MLVILTISRRKEWQPSVCKLPGKSCSQWINGDLDPNEIGKLKTFLTLVVSYNMQAIIDVHNYGRYNSNRLADAAANNGIVAVHNMSGLLLGSSGLPISSFRNLRTKLAGALAGHPGVAGYDIINEPHDLGPGVWPKAAQDAVNGIRSVDTVTTIFVEETGWVNACNWLTCRGNLRVYDPVHHLVYEAHLLFDTNGGGAYAQTYDQQGAYPNWGVDYVQPYLNWLQQKNAKGFIGEYSVPDNDPRWLTVMDNFLSVLRLSGCRAPTQVTRIPIPREIIHGGLFSPAWCQWLTLSRILEVGINPSGAFLKKYPGIFLRVNILHWPGFRKKEGGWDIPRPPLLY